MLTPLRSIGILCKEHSPAITETLHTLWDFLSRQDNLNVVVEMHTAKMLLDKKVSVIAKEHLGQHCELLIVVGGDGSLLHAAHAMAGQNIPLIGINRGNLGFLTDINPRELERTLKPILEGHYQEEKRFLLSAILSSHPDKTFHALNEISLLSSPHMSEFEIEIDDHFVCSHRADGLIIATPTGSTAYALSSGGPIIHPSLNAVVLVPIASHTLTTRPIVVNADGKITIRIANKRAIEHKTSTPHISFDGSLHPMKSSDTVTIVKKTEALRLIHPLHHNYYEALRSKLYWGKKL